MYHHISECRKVFTDWKNKTDHLSGTDIFFVYLSPTFKIQSSKNRNNECKKTMFYCCSDAGNSYACFCCKGGKE